MEKDLYMKDKYPIQSDDLKFDGKNIIIPRYWVDSLCDYIKNADIHDLSDADKDDYKLFKLFLWDVQEYKNRGN